MMLNNIEVDETYEKIKRRSIDRYSTRNEKTADPSKQLSFKKIIFFIWFFPVLANSLYFCIAYKSAVNDFHGIVMLTSCTNWRHICKPIDVNEDAKMTIDVMLPFVNWYHLTLGVPGTIFFTKIYVILHSLENSSSHYVYKIAGTR